MEQAASETRVLQDRKHFYHEFLEFARQYPEMKICLYVHQGDLSLLSREDWFAIVCRLLDLCRAGRLTLVGTRSTPHPLVYLRRVKRNRDLLGGADDSAPGGKSCAEPEVPA